MPNFRQMVVWLLAVCWLLGAAPPGHGQSLAPLTGSPFHFVSPPAGQNSNVVLLSTDETHLFVTNQDSNTITVLNVASDGSLSFQGAYATTPSVSANGLALNPAGDRLYVATDGDTLNVHSVVADGSLTQIQAAPLGTPSSAQNSVVYVSLQGGDFGYVNNNEIPNTVTSFSVLSDGTLSSGSVVDTAGLGNPFGFVASPRLLAGADGRLYTLNEGSSNISVFDIDPATGNLTLVTGSPFALFPGNTVSSGAIAISPDAVNLYAGTIWGGIIKYQIDPASGALSVARVGLAGITDSIDGLVLDSSGSLLIAVLFLSKQIAVVDTATLTPVPNSPFPEDVAQGVGAMALPSYAAGAVLNRAGTLLFTGDSNYTNTQASVYIFTQP